MAAAYPMPTMRKVLDNMSALSEKTDWIRFWFTGGVPIAAIIIGGLWVPLQLRTAIFASIYATASGISVTAGKLNEPLSYWVNF